MIRAFFGKTFSAKQFVPKLRAFLVIVLLAVAGVATTVTMAPAHTSATAMNAQNADAVVVCAYKGFLNREPDATGRAFWRTQYTRSNYNAVWVGNNFYRSSEGQKYENVFGFDKFIQRTYKSCLNRAATANEATVWGTKHLQGMSRAQIFGFIVAAGDKPWLIPAETNCKTMPKNSSVIPKCKANTAGGYANVATAVVPGSNITVNKAWLSNVTNLRSAASKAHFNLQAHQDAGAPAGAGSYRSPATQQWLRDHGYDAAKSVSMHQWGLAVDFDCNGVSLAANSACLTWMRNNAARYGLYQLPRESWHWSSNGS